MTYHDLADKYDNANPWDNERECPHCDEFLDEDGQCPECGWMEPEVTS